MRFLITYVGFEYEVSDDVLVTSSLITYQDAILEKERHCEGKLGFTLDPRNGLKKCKETETLKHCGKSISGWREYVWLYLPAAHESTRIKTITDVLKLFRYVTLFDTTFLKNHEKLSTKQTKFR